MPAAASDEGAGVMVGSDQRAEVGRLRAATMAQVAALAPADAPPGLAALLEDYYRHVPDEDVLTRQPEHLLAAVLSHRALAERRPVGRAVVRVQTPGQIGADDGWSDGHTVVEVVTDDMPFLVDSVTAEMSRIGRAIHLVVHPQLLVRRDAAGVLVQVEGRARPDDVSPEAPEALGHGVHAESWMHVEVDRESDPAVLEQLAADLRRVLGDVRDAVDDYPRMRATALAVADDLGATPPVGRDATEVAEVQRFLRWLTDGAFTFLGYREHRLDSEDDGLVLRGVTGTGLGILRHDQKMSQSFGRLPAAARERARDPHLLVLTKANSRATVHKPSYLDYVGIKVFDASGAVVGERRFLGLFTTGAYRTGVRAAPIIDRKVDEVLRLSGFTPDSHSAKDLVAVLETFPRDELFQSEVAHLLDTALGVMQLQERRRTRLFLRRDDYGRFMSCLVFLPRDRYTTAVRLRIEGVLLEGLGGVSVEYTTRVTESVLARLHVVVRTPTNQALPAVDVAQLEARLVSAIRTWEEDLAELLRSRLGEEVGADVAGRYGAAFPEAYKEDFTPLVAFGDLERVRELEQDPPGAPLRMRLYREADSPDDERRLMLYRAEPLSLTSVLPIFGDLGVEVMDERPYQLAPPGGATPGPRVHLYDFGLRASGPRGWGPAPEGAARTPFEDAFAAVWEGRAESDGLNALVLAASMTWRQVLVLRTYATYLRQAGLTFSQRYVETCLLANVRVARSLVQLFEARFEPDRLGLDPRCQARVETCEALVEEIRTELDDVASLDHDRILRALLGTIRATLRTGFFQRGEDGQPLPYVAVKLDPHAVPDLPAPRPAYEIWVYSPRVEGVHLRFGSVARGGLRWSDRREDFRTEVLGLVKAQMVKNAVIVPTGAKGGFVAKQLPDPGDREAFLAEGVASYRTFICALLDLTDNIVGTGDQATVVAPQRVVRHDGDDTYLVVAADKGTATFSDIANAVATSYGFWLGDAFASGGSVGYDHKAMGITARGAWESVKRHFRELGVDTQSQEHTVAGVGDMSGDVFGNGMLLSRHTRLVAAFDHRHVFLDPAPDAATSFDERRRLFDLPRSSWADYDTTLLSEGGGVYARTLKSVPVSAQAAAALGLGDQPRSMTPAQLMQAILLAPVDLLWNGGIGTYVKASTESHADVGDRANDAIRVDGAHLRCTVVGEGGNLGLTQLGRVEASLHGVRLNTDAIDNSAGVDTSDHEVNIKILLDAVVADGELDVAGRNAVLASMTDQVGALVLRDNYEQNALLGVARSQAPSMLPVHSRLIRALERAGALDRQLEFLPDAKGLARRSEEGIGLTSPEISVLVAYVKLGLTDQLLGSDLPDEPFMRTRLRAYFPDEVVRRYDDRLDAHPLRREIITTSVVNDMVNRAGVTFAFRVQDETAASAVQVARAYVVVREVFGLVDFAHRVETLDTAVPAAAQDALYLELRRLVDRATRWLLQTRTDLVDVAAEIERYRGTVAELGPQVGTLLVGRDSQRMTRHAEHLVDLGAPHDLAVTAASLLDVYALLDVCEVARSTGRRAREVAGISFALSERFQVDALLTVITDLPRADRWDALARAALRYDLYAALEALTVSVIRTVDAHEDDPAARVAAWEAVNGETLRRARDLLGEVSALDHSSIAAVSVALRGLRAVVRSGAPAGAA